MKNYTKVKSVFFRITLISLISITAGLVAVFVYTLLYVPSGITINGIELGDNSKVEANKKIADYFNSHKKEIKLSLKSSGFADHEIFLNDIAAIKNGSTSTLKSDRFLEFYEALPNMFLRKKSINSIPLSIKEEDIDLKISEYAKKINRNPIDAGLTIQNDEIKIISQQNGIKLNAQNLKLKIYDYLNNRFTGKSLNEIKLEKNKGKELEEIIPNPTDDYIENFDHIYSKYSIELWEGADLYSIEKVISILDGTVIENQFSMLRKIKRVDIGYKLDDEILSVTASSMFAALLEAGVPYSSIQRTPHLQIQDYIRPGLDVKISQDKNVDLKVSNATGNLLMLKLKYENNLLKVYVLGNKKGAQKTKELVFLEQKLYSGSIVEEVKELEEGTTKIIAEGKDGVSVKVYTKSKNSDSSLPDKPEFQIKYEPIKAIIYIGPNTEWIDDNKDK